MKIPQQTSRVAALCAALFLSSSLLAPDRILASDDIKGSVPVKKRSSRTQLAGLARVSLKTALATVAAQDGGRPVKVELEVEDDFLVWSVELAARNGKIHEYLVDAGTGKILKREVEDAD